MKKLTYLILLTLGLSLFLSAESFAIKLMFKDSKGHYHFKCTDKTGGKTIIMYRAEGVFVDGPTGQMFYPSDSASTLRSIDSIKITEKYARMGCREHMRKGP